MTRRSGRKPPSPLVDLDSGCFMTSMLEAATRSYSLADDVVKQCEEALRPLKPGSSEYIMIDDMLTGAKGFRDRAQVCINVWGGKPPTTKEESR